MCSIAMTIEISPAARWQHMQW